ncbi:MAG: hypothetical protein IIY94_01960 [Oscillospiraceae bacterium]|nr:hypothetical protein [Oscillospiraceae bacterium]
MLNDFIFNIILFANVFLALYIIRAFWKRPLSFDLIIGALYLVFYYIKIIDSRYHFGMFSSQLQKINGYFENSDSIVKFSAISFVVIVSFMIGFRIEIKLNNRVFIRKKRGYSYSVVIYRLFLMKCFFLFSVLIVIIRGLATYKYGIINYFSMARKEAAYANSLDGLLIGVLPTIILSIEYIIEIKTKGRLSPKFILYTILALLATITQGQRRELINCVIFIALLLLESKIIQRGWESLRKKNKATKYTLAVLGILIVIMIPVTWYMRVYSTQRQYGHDVDPFQYRGWLELIFGSSSSGYDTSVILDGFIKDYGMPFLVSVQLLLTFFIPRSIMPDKAMLMTRYVQQEVGTSGNLSVFYINDVWFNFYWFSPIVSLLIGYIIKRIIAPINEDRDPIDKIVGFLAFSKVTTLFKNGFVSFFSGLIVFALFWWITISICTQKNQIAKEA